VQAAFNKTGGRFNLKRCGKFSIPNQEKQNYARTLKPVINSLMANDAKTRKAANSKNEPSTVALGLRSSNENQPIYELMA